MILHGDSLEVLKTLPENSVDAVICDPPYGTTACKWDAVIPFEQMWVEIKRLIKPGAAVVLFGSEPFSTTLRQSNLANFKYDWIWKKSNPSNIALAKKQPMKYHEIISVFHAQRYFPVRIKRDSPRIRQAQKANYTFHNSGSEQTALKYIEKSAHEYDAEFKCPSSVLEFNSLRPNAKEFVKHPTQKPVALMEYLVKTYSKAGETVLDFAMGSGSTGVACANLGRKFIGIEREAEYVAIASKRVANASKRVANVQTVS